MTGGVRRVAVTADLASVFRSAVDKAGEPSNAHTVSPRSTGLDGRTLGCAVLTATAEIRV
jgi:hypothetical protein